MAAAGSHADKIAVHTERPARDNRLRVSLLFSRKKALSSLLSRITCIAPVPLTCLHCSGDNGHLWMSSRSDDKRRLSGKKVKKIVEFVT